MKRVNEDVAGRRPPLAPARRDVAGVRVAPVAIEVASFRDAMLEPLGPPVSDPELLADFAEFLLDDEEDPDEPGRLAPDPVFAARLKQKLWWTFMTHRVDGGGEVN